MSVNSPCFPDLRLRRNRKSLWIRDLIAEHNLMVSDLIMPFFVTEGVKQKQETQIEGIYRLSIDLLVEEIKKAADMGIKAVMIFPATEQKLKSSNAKEAYNPDNLICRTVKTIKEKVKADIGIICDVALDPYTDHGHDGILAQDKKYILNDQTVEILCKQALVQAQAGCDIVAPSDMMDGRVKAIRNCLDQNGFENVNIMSYAAKYASSFYGPFRSALGSISNLKNADKSSYQMDSRNSDEAIREIAMDVREGADMIIIKPGICYLDIVAKAKLNFNLPIISYQVSGEYAMLKLAAKNNLIDFKSALIENLTAFKRAGASAIISYGSMEAIKLIK